MSIAGLLFDLDGTLADTAPDLVAVLNTVLAEAARPPMPYAIARNEVSNGALGLLRLGFGLAPTDPVAPELRQRFLDVYARSVCDNSKLFISLKGINELLSLVNGRWGIVTNKPEFLTGPLLERLGLAGAADCVVSGDTLPERKPHPAPLRHAAALLGLPVANCVYVGDARRDIEAGRAAGMHTLAAAWGYIRAADDPRAWAADAIIVHPSDLAAGIDRLSTTR